MYGSREKTSWFNVKVLKLVRADQIHHVIPEQESIYIIIIRAWHVMFFGNVWHSSMIATWLHWCGFGFGPEELVWFWFNSWFNPGLVQVLEFRVSPSSVVVRV